MLDRDHHKRKTDQAWNLLYRRLEKEGLLPQGEEVALKGRAPGGGNPASSAQRTISGENGPGISPSRMPSGQDGADFSMQRGPDERRLRFFPRTALRRAAAAAVLLCLCLTGAWWWSSRSAWQPPLLTLQNEADAATLVTTLEDGSIVYLAGNTQLQYPAHFPPNRRVVSLEGNALFDISGNRRRPFIIDTEQTRIEVLGTAFNVKSSTVSPFELSVQRGEVRVTLKTTGEEVRVKAGETVTLFPGQLRLSATEDTGQFDRYTWRIQFKDEPLGNILRVLNLSYPTGIRLETTPALAERRLTVSFRQETPQDMAQLICLALRLHCRQEGNRLMITEP